MISSRSLVSSMLAILAGTCIAGGAFAVNSSLAVTKSGSGSGVVTSDVGAINCGATCSDTYANGTTITLTATPAAGSQFTGWLGPCTGVGTCHFSINAPTTAAATFASTTLGVPRLDIDGTATCNALTDGLLAIRTLFGLSGASLINGAVGTGAVRTSGTQIGDYIADIKPRLDIDGNGQVDALTDGLLIARYLLGLRGADLIAGSVGSGATRTTAADIERQLHNFCLTATPTYVFTIVMSNHDYGEIVGSANAPYINSLIGSYGLATNYMDAGHPSLPNYLYLISGNTQYPGGIDLGPTVAPYFPATADNLANQLDAAGITWRSYQESMGTPCKLTSSGSYTPTKDPFLYFSNVQSPSAHCVATNRDYSEFAADLAAGTYHYMWISPNLVHSGHDPTTDPVAALSASDTWLATEIPKILASTAYQAGGVIFLTWDQAEGRNGDAADQVPMIVISPAIKSAGFTSNRAYSHASYLATVEDIFTLPRLNGAQNADNLFEFFAP